MDTNTVSAEEPEPLCSEAGEEEQAEENKKPMPLLWLATEVAAACGLHPFRSQTDALGTCLTRYAGPTARAWAADRSLVSPIPGPKPVVDDAAVEHVNDVESLTVAVKAMVSSPDATDATAAAETAEWRKKENAVRHAVHQRLGHNREAETLRACRVSKEAERRGKWFRSRLVRHDIKIGGRMDAITPKGRPIEVKTRMYRLPKDQPPLYDIIQVIVYMVLTESDCGVLIERTLDKTQMRITRLWWEEEEGDGVMGEGEGEKGEKKRRASPYHDDDCLKAEELDLYNMRQIWEDQVCPQLIRTSMTLQDIVASFRAAAE